MDKTIAGVIGAITGLASLDGAAQAATTPTPGPDALPGARSYAELLDPIPNAVALLRAADAAAARERRDETVNGLKGDVQVADHHHHHHHRYYHHHHHHHHRVIVIRPPWRVYRPHHHHHHHNHY